MIRDSRISKDTDIDGGANSVHFEKLRCISLNKRKTSALHWTKNLEAAELNQHPARKAGAQRESHHPVNRYKNGEGVRLPSPKTQRSKPSKLDGKAEMTDSRSHLVIGENAQNPDSSSMAGLTSLT